MPGIYAIGRGNLLEGKNITSGIVLLKMQLLPLFFLMGQLKQIMGQILGQILVIHIPRKWLYSYPTLNGYDQHFN